MNKPSNSTNATANAAATTTNTTTRTSQNNNSNAGHYVVTAHRPGGIITSAKCSFLEPSSTVSINFYGIL